MFEVPYATDTVRIAADLLPGNDTSDNPLEFDIVPPWGPDLARLKSLMLATTGLTDDGWSPAMQELVIKAFETGASAFVNTVTAVRGLSVPRAMALRAGIEIHDPKTQRVQITTGVDFSKVCGALQLAPIALHVAFQIVALSKKQDVDPRFFVQPSGSGGAATVGAGNTSVTTAPNGSGRRGTAAERRARKKKSAPGTSAPKPSSSSVTGQAGQS